MQLSRSNIQKIFQDLIECRMSREDADRWAYARIRAFDADELSFHPKADEDLLWDAISYLYGIDLKVSPDEYLHSISEIRAEYQSRWKD